MREKNGSHLDDPVLDALGLSEAEALAWIEGEADEALEARVGRLLEGAPAQAAGVLVAMRRDGAVLNTMDQAEACPRGLAEGAIKRWESMNERELLVGLSDGPPIAFARPRTRVRRAPGWVMDAIFDTAAGRVSVAALIAASLGIGVYLAMDARPVGEGEPTEVVIADATPVVDAPAEPGAELGVAVAEAEAAPAARSDAPIAVAAAEPMTIARALSLLEERRLMLRVHTQDASQTLVRLHALDERAGGGGAWRLLGPAPARVASALAEPGGFVDDDAREGARIPFAALQGPVEELGPVVELDSAFGRRHATAASSVFLGEVRADELSLTALVGRLGLGDVVRVELVELESPLAADAEAAPTRESVLWWERPIEMWPARATVAIVVEQSE